MTIELDEGVVPRNGTGPVLYHASAMPTGGAKAVLAIVPGYADHGARYAHVMGALAEHGIGSVAIDLRGHGRAQGIRGFCARFDEYLDDVRELRRLVDARAQGAPTLLFGHSFGGLVAALSVLEDSGSWKGLVLSAPLFGLELEVPRLTLAAGRIASRLYPKFAVPTGLAGKDLSHDAAKAREYDHDPLVFEKATARWYTEATAAQRRALASASRLTMPLYMAFGTADKINSMQAGKRFFDDAGSADKTWDPREGLFHEILNEPSWKDIVESIARWVLAHAR